MTPGSQVCKRCGNYEDTPGHFWGCQEDEPAGGDNHLTWWDAARFVWHFHWHRSHAATVTYDEASNVVRCGCGKTWGRHV